MAPARRYHTIVLTGLSPTTICGTAQVHMSLRTVTPDGAWKEVLARIERGLAHTEHDPLSAIAAFQSSLGIGLLLPKSSNRRHYAVMRSNVGLSFAFTARRGMKNIDRGIRHLRKAVTHGHQLGAPKEACVACGKVALRLLKRGMASQSEELLTWALDTLSTYRDTHKELFGALVGVLGQTYHQQGDLDRAISAYEDEVQLRPSVEGTANLAGALKQKGEYSRAIESFTRALGLCSELKIRQRLLRGLAQVYSDAGDPSNAQRCNAEAERYHEDVDWVPTMSLEGLCDQTS